ncbi:signal peptidase I [Clostridium tarantellae]|uniref:Signal peptidase I n=1 Tax=Clostridium tarantellae TaxID=39493 RepID=A0A6I1MK96_9CLOT|nr:signal peptidase I [Clostridium tarantellae]MPQ42602.1 signal peptidase I [Clostridium tarantellae]
MNKETIKKSFLLDWIVPIAAAVILALLINHFVLFKISVPTESMVPTVEAGDQLFVTRIYNPNKIKRGDIVVFKSEEFEDLLLKRVIGLPGDHVEVKEDGSVYINGEYLSEPYVKNVDYKAGIFDVPEGKFLMFGDNRANSNDSRYWHNPYVDGSEIKAKARIIVYPFNRIGLVH